MASDRTRVGAILARDLALTVVVGLLIYLAFVLGAIFFPNIPGLWLRLLAAGAVVLVGYLFARVFASAVAAVLRASGGAGHIGTVRFVFDLLVAAGVILALLSIFGVSIESLFIGGAFAGLVLGLASQTVLANLFAGVTILLGSPFRVGERISISSSSYGALGPSYPHELLYPYYTGTVRDIGILYTELQLDTGRLARLPNSVVLGALVVNLSQSEFHALRVRVTLPYTVSPAVLDGVLPALGAELGGSSLEAPAPRATLADISPASWDAVVTIWTSEPNEERVRDRVLRAVWNEVGGGRPGAPAPAPRPNS